MFLRNTDLYISDYTTHKKELGFHTYISIFVSYPSDNILLLFYEFPMNKLIYFLLFYNYIYGFVFKSILPPRDPMFKQSPTYIPRFDFSGISAPRNKFFWQCFMP